MGSHSPGLSVISVWIELGSEPIRGAISYGATIEAPFHGWLELLVVLDAAHRGEVVDPASAAAEDDEDLGEHPGADRNVRAVLPLIGGERPDPTIGDGGAAEGVRTRAAGTAASGRLERLRERGEAKRPVEPDRPAVG